MHTISDRLEREAVPEHSTWREECVLRELYTEQALALDEIREWIRDEHGEEVPRETLKTVLWRKGIRRESAMPRSGLARELWES